MGAFKLPLERECSRDIAAFECRGVALEENDIKQTASPKGKGDVRPIQAYTDHACLET